MASLNLMTCSPPLLSLPSSVTIIFSVTIGGLAGVMWPVVALVLALISAMVSYGLSKHLGLLTPPRAEHA